MLKIGYVRLRDAAAEAATAALKAAGCHVVRAEEPDGDGQVLDTILDFAGPGDQLVVLRLERLATTGRGLLDALDRLEARGASLSVLEPRLCSAGAEGAILRMVLEAVAEAEPALPARRRGPAPVHEICALQRAGVGPVEIARRLGVSRMTVWRKLKALESAGA